MLWKMFTAYRYWRWHWSCWRSVVIIHFEIFACYFCDYIHESLVLRLGFFALSNTNHNEQTNWVFFFFCMLPISWFIDLSWHVIFSLRFFFLLWLPSAPHHCRFFFLWDFIFATNLFGNFQYIFKVFFSFWPFATDFLSFCNGILETCRIISITLPIDKCADEARHSKWFTKKNRKGAYLMFTTFLCQFQPFMKLDIRFFFLSLPLTLVFPFHGNRFTMEGCKKVSEIIMRKFNMPSCT